MLFFDIYIITGRNRTFVGLISKHGILLCILYHIIYVLLLYLLKFVAE